MPLSRCRSATTLMGRWAYGDDTIFRTSIGGQGDAVVLAGDPRRRVPRVRRRWRSLVQPDLDLDGAVHQCRHPTVASIAAQPNELTGFLFKGTNGHLLVIVGFTANGDVVVDDPAETSDASVQ